MCVSKLPSHSRPLVWAHASGITADSKGAGEGSALKRAALTRPTWQSCQPVLVWSARCWLKLLNFWQTVRSDAFELLHVHAGSTQPGKNRKLVLVQLT